MLRRSRRRRGSSQNRIRYFLLFTVYVSTLMRILRFLGAIKLLSKDFRDEIHVSEVLYNKFDIEGKAEAASVDACLSRPCARFCASPLTIPPRRINDYSWYDSRVRTWKTATYNTLEKIKKHYSNVLEAIFSEQLFPSFAHLHGCSSHFWNLWPEGMVRGRSFTRNGWKTASKKTAKSKDTSRQDAGPELPS